jgi:hypothetical protein
MSQVQTQTKNPFATVVAAMPDFTGWGILQKARNLIWLLLLKTHAFFF